MLLGRTLRCLVLGLAAALVAGCTGAGGPAGPGVDASALNRTTPTLAFEPVTGIPEERTAVLAEALVTGAVSRGVMVVPRDADDAVYRVKGYFSAARAGNATEVSYAWDVFDRNDVRVRRISGTESIGATVPNPWQAVTDDALRRVASRTVEELEAWLARDAPAAGQMSRVPVPAQGSAEGVTALLPAAAGPAPVAGRTSPSVHVGAVQGVGAEGAAVLARALAAQLAAAGIGRASDPVQADYLVTGEATIGPVHDGAQNVAIIWSVVRSDGAELGTVRQVRRVTQGTAEADWEPAAREAAGAAMPGIVALLQSQ